MSTTKTPPPLRRPRPAPAHPLVGGVERLDPALDALVAPDARLEVLAQGYKWSEGPVWTGGALLFSDVPNNVIWRWHEAAGRARVPAPERLHRQRPARRRAGLERPGRRRRRAPATCASTAIAGSRAWRSDGKTFETVADRFDGKRFNSPNDLVVRAERRRLLHRSDLRPRRAREGSGARDPLERRLPRARRRRRRRARQDADLPERPRVLARRQDAVRRACRIRRARSGWPTTSTPRAASPTGACSSTRRRREGGQEGAARRDEDRRRRQPVRDRPGRRVRVLARGQAPRHHRHRRADRQLRVRRRRPDAVHDRQRQADAHPAARRAASSASRHGVDRAGHRRRRRPAPAQVPLAAAGRAAATTTCCSARWRCWSWGRSAASPPRT